MLSDDPAKVGGVYDKEQGTKNGPLHVDVIFGSTVCLDLRSVAWEDISSAIVFLFKAQRSGFLLLLLLLLIIIIIK